MQHLSPCRCSTGGQGWVCASRPHPEPLWSIRRTVSEGEGATPTDLLDILANRENRAVLAALTHGPSYPRRLAERLSRPETEVSRRLRVLERARLVQGRWARERGRNIRRYHLSTRRFEVVLEAAGYRVETPVAPAVPRIRPVGASIPTRRPLFGREEELAQIQDPRIRLAMVVGIAGMGKTSLAAEFAHRTSTPVFWHACTSFDSTIGLLEEIARWASAEDSPLARMFERPGLDLAAAIDRITDRLATGPVVLVFDDYHKVQDEGLTEVLERWRRTVPRAKILVLSRTRPPFDLDEASALLLLGGLRPEASRALLRTRGVHVPEDELAELQRRYGGHPLALLLTPRRRGGGSEGAAFLQDLGRAALDAVDPRSKTVLLALACMGRPVRTEDLQGLTGLEDPLLALTSLERRGFVRAASGAWEAHEVLREGLAPLVDARPQLHRSALRLCRASGEPEAILEGMDHAIRSGNLADAIQLLEADLLENRPGLVEKGPLRPYLALLEALPTDRLDDRNRALAAYGQGTILSELGRTSAAIQAFHRARRLAIAAGERRLLALVMRQLSVAFLDSGRPDAAERAALRYHTIVTSEGWDERRADALWRLHTVYHRRGAMEPARRFYRLAFREARRSGDRPLVLQVTTFCSMSWPREWRRVMPTLRRRGRIFRRQGRPRQVAYVHAYLGEIACRSARWSGRRGRSFAEQALVDLDRAIQGFEALGDRQEAANARAWKALSFLLMGRHDDARQEATAVLSLRRTIGLDHSMILAHQVLSEVHRREGRLAAARVQANTAVAVARRFDCRCTGVALIERCLVEAAGGRRASARKIMEKALADTERRGYPDEVRFARREARRMRVHVH